MDNELTRLYITVRYMLLDIATKYERLGDIANAKNEIQTATGHYYRALGLYDAIEALNTVFEHIK